MLVGAKPLRMEVIQVNLHHSRAATGNLLGYMCSNNISAALIQEPWIDGQGRIQGLKCRDFTLFYKSGVSKHRSCILVNNKIKMFLMDNFSSEDTTVVKWERSKSEKPLLLISSYMPYDSLEPPPSEQIKKVVEERKYDLLIGCDANAHHTFWGSTDTNCRGESILDFLSGTNLNICNRGTAPTFITRNRKEVLDLTLATNSSSLMVRNWRVSEAASLSDHCWILFRIEGNLDRRMPFRNPRKANWEKYKEILDSTIAPPHRECLDNGTKIDRAVSYIGNAMISAFDKCCPVSRTSNGKKPPWWNVEVGECRGRVRTLHNKAKRSNSPQDWDDYKIGLREFKYIVRKAKRQSWRNFCESLENTNETARLRKILVKEPIIPNYIRKEDGTWADSCQETLDTLMSVHFPGSQPASDKPTKRAKKGSQELWNLARNIVTEEKMIWAIKLFDPHKSPGPDGIRPMMLQQLPRPLQKWLVVIFRSCLYAGHVPEKWREAKVVFIPKPGKNGHTTAKDYRPISLSSFLLKTMERLLETYIRSCCSEGALSTAQHAYCKGKSVETALHETVSKIEASLQHKEYTLAAFLDIEGAFNNVKTEAIVKAVEETGANMGVVNWIAQMLNTRAVSSKWGTGEARLSVSRGTPQGGVLSPFLWLLVMNSILIELRNEGYEVNAYADDLVITITGKFLDTISLLMERGLNILTRWADKCGLSVNPKKTELVLFTRKRKIPNFRLPRLKGVELPLSSSAKYLGIVLDSKLDWNKNIEERAKKATSALFSCKRFAGKKWGIKPEMAHWLYTSIVRPILTYGAVVWWPAVNKKVVTNRLEKVQRMACVGMTGALRTTPTLGLEIMLGLHPIKELVKNIAAKGALRLRESGILKYRQYTHSRILSEFHLDTRGVHTDYLVPYTDFCRNFTTIIPTREEWNLGNVLTEDGKAIFTDGSKTSQGTGSGIYSEELDIMVSIRLPDHGSVFQAEVLAIARAAELAAARVISREDITIYVDSQAALKALESNTIKSSLVKSCREVLQALCRQCNTVKLCWVPGHCNIEGNEKADSLAREGSETDIGSADHSVLPPIGIVRNKIDETTRSRVSNIWKTTGTCQVARSLWPEINVKNTRVLLSLNRNNLRIMVGTLTGHCLLGKMAKRLGLITDDLCRACQDIGVVEDVRHMLCECPSLMRGRLRLLGQYHFNSLGEVSGISLMNILRFVKGTNWIQ